MMTPRKDSFVYDPMAVDMVRHLCELHNAKCVLNSMHNWNGEQIMRHQVIVNNMNDFMHPDSCCTVLGTGPSRIQSIHQWLQGRDVEDWIVIDDVDVGTNRQVHVNFDIGMTLENFLQAHELFGGKRPSIICARGQELATATEHAKITT